jgi:hypothetical protein
LLKRPDIPFILEVKSRLNNLGNLISGIKSVEEKTKVTLMLNGEKEETYLNKIIII